MEPDKGKPRQTGRGQYVADLTRELDRTIQRKLQQQQQQLDASGWTATASHGEDRSFDHQPGEPTWPDRAG